MIDAPPVLATTEAIMLARHVDEVIFVVEADATPEAALGAAMDELLDANPNVSLLLNRCLIGPGGSYYGSYGDYDRTERAGCAGRRAAGTMSVGEMKMRNSTRQVAVRRRTLRATLLAGAACAIAPGAIAQIGGGGGADSAASVEVRLFRVCRRRQPARQLQRQYRTGARRSGRRRAYSIQHVYRRCDLFNVAIYRHRER